MYQTRCDLGAPPIGVTLASFVLRPAVVCLVLLIPASANAVTIVVPGDVVDAFMTEAPTDVDLPPLPADFFGPGSDPFTGEIQFPLQGHPYPDKFGVPTPFPQDQSNLDITWYDRHGNTVSADSQHKVSSNVKVIGPTAPYNFDTVVMRKDSATFNGPGLQTVDIEMTWLSLKSIDPLTITFNGGNSSTTYDVYVGLSSLTPQVAGRMAMSATTVGAGTASGSLDLGAMGSLVDLQFEGGDFGAFGDLPNALGLPVFYQIRLENTAFPGDYHVIDDYDGTVFGMGMNTTSVFHDQNEFGPGGEFSYVPEPSALALLLFGLASLGVFRRLRRR